jgi:hypothetical protein
MENNNNAKLVTDIVESLENKDFEIYFYTIDTAGNQKGAIANTYDVVKNLITLGYNAKILHEKTTYLDNHPAGWLGDDYLSVPHVSMESKPKIKPQDFVIVPEVLGNVMKTMAENKFPSKNLVFCQSPDYIFELLEPGHTWGMYNFNDVLTTSETNAKLVNDFFPSVKTHVATPVVPEYFKPSGKLKKPIVAIHARDQSDYSKIYKSFLIKYPMLRWVTFKDLRGLNKEEFAEILADSCLSVWVDDVAGYGTFPIESIECETPIIIKLPNQIPDWAVNVTEEGVKLKDIAMWTDNINTIPGMINTYLQTYLEDNVSEELLTNMSQAKGNNTNDDQIAQLDDIFTSLVEERIKEFKTLTVA